MKNIKIKNHTLSKMSIAIIPALGFTLANAAETTLASKTSGIQGTWQ